jgi:hypothetical protein
MTRTKDQYFAVLDESISQNGNVSTYVIAASIFKEPRIDVERVFITFLEGARIFKTNRLWARKRYNRIRTALKWNCLNSSLNICSWHVGENFNQEGLRQFCLAKVLIALQEKEVWRCIMDSRANPDAQDWSEPNRKDLYTLGMLRRQRLISERLELSHLTDHECALIGTADVVSWSTRKYLIGEDPTFWNLISSHSILI